MGTRFRIAVRAPAGPAVQQAIDAAFEEIERIERLLSNFRDDSEISAVNRSAGRGPVAVGADLLAVLDRALTISSLTRGAFDITFAACQGIWSVRERRIAREEEIQGCLAHVGYQRVALDRGAAAVLLPDPQMRLGLGGIAKGYGIDRAAAVLERAGILEWAVDGGGDIRVRAREGVEPWTMGIAHPRRSGESLGTLVLHSGAVATSGDYERYFEHDGIRYHHIIDPATGRPARRSVAATVLAATAMDADALATALFVLGPELGLAVAESLDGVEALVVAPDLSIHRSSGFPRLLPEDTVHHPLASGRLKGGELSP